MTDSPRIVAMTGGVEHAHFVGHAYLASRLGLNLAEGADLVVRKRRLWLRSLAGLEPVDVVHRRLEGYRVDPMEVNAHGVMGVPGLLDAVRAGGVRLANNHGTGVIEDPVLAEHWDDAGDWISDRHRRGGSLSPLPRLSADGPGDDRVRDATMSRGRRDRPRAGSSSACSSWRPTGGSR